MRPIFSQPSVEANMTPSAPSVERANAGAAFERLATRLRTAGLVWAQSEPGHVRWSLADDFLTSLVADSAWIRRQVDDAAQRWMNGAPTTPEQPIPGCWLLPSGSRQRSDGVARGVAIAITSKAVGSSGSLRALCQSANLDFELTRDLLRSEPMVTIREIPRLAAMVRLLRPVALRPTGTPAVEALLRAVESTHRCVRGHSERTAHLAECLAGAAGMTAGECRTARMAGLLHDVGKMGIPEQVLSKPGSLTAEERSLVNMHPEIGHRIVQGVGGLEHAVPAVLWHHERWDGAGYPHRLSGEAIPKIARVMAIVDSYDAMRSDRPYRQALSPEHALREIHCGSGKQFDPALSQAFVRLLDQQPALAA